MEPLEFWLRRLSKKGSWPSSSFHTVYKLHGCWGPHCSGVGGRSQPCRGVGLYMCRPQTFSREGGM